LKIQTDVLSLQMLATAKYALDAHAIDYLMPREAG